MGGAHFPVFNPKIECDQHRDGGVVSRREVRPQHINGFPLGPITSEQGQEACVATSLRCHPAFHFGGAV